MATRYAGDYFGISLGDGSESSELLRYFPGLKKVTGTGKKEEEGAVTKGGYTIPTPFAGFKTFEQTKPRG